MKIGVGFLFLVSSAAYASLHNPDTGTGEQPPNNTPTVYNCAASVTCSSSVVAACQTIVQVSDLAQCGQALLVPACGAGIYFRGPLPAGCSASTGSGTSAPPATSQGTGSSSGTGTVSTGFGTPSKCKPGYLWVTWVGISGAKGGCSKCGDPKMNPATGVPTCSDGSTPTFQGRAP